jgi:cold shock CspA family protein
VRIELSMPRQKRLVVASEPPDHEMHTRLDTIARSSFESMERKLKDEVARRRRDVKAHPEPRAFVKRILRAEGYGFIEAPDGTELYFHRNSVLHRDFDALEVGTEVRFESEMGDEGPQATSVQIVANPGPMAGGVAVRQATARARRLS